MSVLGGRAPDPHTVVVTRGDKDLMINRIPGNTVDGAGVTSEDSDGFISLDMVNINLVVLGSGGHKRLIHASKTTVDGIKALSNSIEFPDKRSASDVPHSQSLRGNVEQGVSVSLIQCERHDS